MQTNLQIRDFGNYRNFSDKRGIRAEDYLCYPVLTKRVFRGCSVEFRVIVVTYLANHEVLMK